MIAAIVATVSIIAVVVSLMMTKLYKAEAVIMPVSSSGGGGGLSAITSQLGGLASLAGLNISGGASDSDKLATILKSRTLAENVIEQENLMPVLYRDSWDKKKDAWKDDSLTPNMEDAVRKMKGIVTVSEDKKTKVISLSVLTDAPELSAHIANAYLAELQNFINDNALTTAKRNRLFIEGQLEENKKDLLEAGKEINAFYNAKGVSNVESDVDVSVGMTESPDASLDRKPRFAARDMQDDPALRNLLAEKIKVEEELAKAKTVRDVPQQVYLAYLMLRRELLAKVNAILTTQYEMAKIEESKEDLAFQVIDQAVVPIKRTSPKRAKICMISFFTALFAAIFIAFFVEYMKKVKTMSHKN